MVKQIIGTLALCALVNSIVVAGPNAVLWASPQVRGGTPEAIRARAQRLSEFRALLADKDPNVRLETLDTMLNADDAPVRELAFETGFASDDSAMRAMALRVRVLSMKRFSLEPNNVKNIPENEWATLIGQVGLPGSFQITAIDPKTGNFEMAGNWVGRVSGQEVSFSVSGYSARLRLSDGAVLLGTFTFASRRVLPVKWTLQ